MTFTVQLLLISISTYAEKHEGFYFSFEIESTCDKYLVKIPILLFYRPSHWNIFFILFFILYKQTHFDLK